MADIQIAAPDGSIVAFPEGTSDDVIANAMRSQFGGPKEPPSTAMDMAKSFGTGALRGGAAFLGLPGMMNDIADKMVRAGGKAVGFPVPENAPKPRFDLNPPTQAEILAPLQGLLHTPETRAGKYAQSVGEFVPAAVAGPGGIFGNLIRFGLIPGLTSEAAGQATEGTAFETPARVAGGLIGALGGAALGRPSTAQGIMGEALGGTEAASIRQAETLMREARQRGITLTWPEAIQQVTNSGTKLGDVQRVVESSQAGGAVMRPALAQRAGQVEQAVGNAADQIAAPGMNPFQIGPRTGRAAESVVNEARDIINGVTDPLYRMASRTPVPAGDMARMRALPGWDEASSAVMGDPQLARYVRGLPENSVGFLNEVKKNLETAADNATAPLTGRRNMQRAAGYGSDAAAVRETAANLSPWYRGALTQQQDLRTRYLDPLVQGPVGRVARSDIPTEQAVDALLPRAPLAGSQGQTGATFRALAAREPEATANVVRQRFENTFNSAGRDLVGGPNEWSGARFRAGLFGDRQARSNFMEALEGASGPAAAREVGGLMEILQATGRRQPPGSMTEFNRQMTKAMEGGGVIPETVTSAGKLNPLGWAKDRYQQYRYGANAEGLARLLLNEDAAPIIIDALRPRGANLRPLGIGAVLSQKAIEDRRRDTRR